MTMALKNYYWRKIKNWIGKCVGERFIKTLKKKIYKHISVVSKLEYTDKLDKIVEKYNNAYHGTIRMKPTDIKSGM